MLKPVDPKAWLVGSLRDFRSVAQRLGLPARSLEAVALVRTIAILIQHIETRRWAAAGLGVASGWVLIELALQGPSRPGDLATSFLVTPGGMSQVISSLERKGLVRKEADPNDRRALTISLTSQGRRLIDDQMPQLRKALLQLEAEMGKSRLTELSEMLEELLIALHKIDGLGGEQKIGGHPRPKRR